MRIFTIMFLVAIESLTPDMKLPLSSPYWGNNGVLQGYPVCLTTARWCGEPATSSSQLLCPLNDTWNQGLIALATSRACRLPPLPGMRESALGIPRQFPLDVITPGGNVADLRARITEKHILYSLYGRTNHGGSLWLNVKHGNFHWISVRYCYMWSY